MDNASSVVESGVHLPVYESIAGNMLRQFEHASSVASTSTDDEGETYDLVYGSTGDAVSCLFICLEISTFKQNLWEGVMPISPFLEIRAPDRLLPVSNL